MSYKPLDLDYPTNYPGSNEIPAPSGIWLDMVRGLGEAGDLPFLVRTNQSWAWTGARSNLSTAAATFEPPKFTTELTGYRNPVTTANRYDSSTIGLQIVPQLANNEQPEPVVIPIPVKNAGTYLKASITVVCENGGSDAGVAFSMGFAGVGADGTPLYIPPNSFSDFYDRRQANPRNIVFNLNPELRFNDNLKYIISWLPGSGLDFRLRLVDLTITDSRLDGATGCVLISCVGIPNATAVAGQANLLHGSSWEFRPNDPNHILLKHNGVRYEDLFSDRPGSANPETGAKKPWMLYLKDDTGIGLYSYHSVLQVRPEGDRTTQDNYTTGRARVMIHPFVSRDIQAIPNYQNWTLSIHRMPLVVITGVTIRSRIGAIELPIEEYASGVRARASALNALSNTINKGLLAPISVSPSYNRVKGTSTVGSLCDEVVLEKNEITPWNYYDATTTYGPGVIPGIQLTSSFSTYELKGHNSVLAYSCITSTTPRLAVVKSTNNNYRVDFVTNGDDENRNYSVPYVLPIGQTGVTGYLQSLDPSIRTMPLDLDLVDVALLNGNDRETMDAAASFSPMGIVDCYYNINVPDAYRPGIGGRPYPIGDSSTPFLRASGFINNYGSAGGLTIKSAQWVFGSLPGQSDFQLPYNVTESVVDRGSMDILTLTGPVTDLTAIELGTIFFSHAHIVYLTYTPEFP